jgi:multicomponent Na+:H+ antiporter subunit E
MRHIRYILPLLLVYLALTSDLSFSNLVLGVLIASSVSYLLHPQEREFNPKRLPAAVLAMIQYIAILAVDVGKNGLQVARIVLTPSLPIEPGIIAIPSLCETEAGTALSAHAITVSPGELVVEISEDGTMYTHCLDATNSDAKATEAQRLRVNLLQKIFP